MNTRIATALFALLALLALLGTAPLMEAQPTYINVTIPSGADGYSYTLGGGSIGTATLPMLSSIPFEKQNTWTVTIQCQHSSACYVKSANSNVNVNGSAQFMMTAGTTVTFRLRAGEFVTSGADPSFDGSKWTWTKPVDLGSSHPTLEGVTSTGATGTGKLVYGTGPSIDAPTLTGAVTATGTLSVGDSVPTGALPGSLAVAGRVYQPTSKKVVTLGDSNTGTATYSANQIESSWAFLLERRSFGSYWLLNNAGIPGNTTAQMLARVQADVVAYHPEICFVMGGTNDNLAGTSPTTSLANLSSIVDALIVAGIRPIVFTALPNNVGSWADMLTLRAGILAFAPQKGVTVFDVYSLFVVPGGTTIIPTYTPDGIHLNNVGATLLADSVISTYGGVNLDSVGLPLATGTETWNLQTNGLMNYTTGTVATGWACTNSSYCSIESAIHGNQEVLTLNGSNDIEFYSSSGISITAGHRYSIAARVETTGTALYSFYGQWNSSPMSFFYATTNTGSTLNLAKGTVLHVEGAAPAGATNLTIVMYGISGTGAIKVSQVTIRDLTTFPLFGLSASGSSCTITAIANGQITAATCAP